MGDLIRLHDFKGHDVRVAVEDNEPWFIAKDVCDILGLENVSKALIELDQRDKKDLTGSKVGSKSSKLRTINESGVYTLVFKSRKPEALEFQRWVTHEVLPQIRKTGGYIPVREGETREQFLARAFLVADETMKQQAELIKELKPKADKFMRYMDENGMTTLQNLGRILGYKPNKLTGALRALGWLSRKRRNGQWTNEPNQKALQAGYFRLIVTEGDGWVNTQTFVTAKGVMWIADMIESGQLYLPPEWKIAA